MRVYGASWGSSAWGVPDCDVSELWLIAFAVEASAHSVYARSGRHSTLAPAWGLASALPIRSVKLPSIRPLPGFMNRAYWWASNAGAAEVDAGGGAWPVRPSASTPAATP